MVNLRREFDGVIRRILLHGREIQRGLGGKITDFDGWKIVIGAQKKWESESKRIGIVLGEINFGEHSRIFEVHSDKYGKAFLEGKKAELKRYGFGGYVFTIEKCGACEGYYLIAQRESEEENDRRKGIFRFSDSWRHIA